MPLVRCPECARSQTIRRELAGLIVSCERCGVEFRAIESSKRVEKPTKREPFDFRGFLRGAGLVVGLILGVGLVFGVIVLIIRANQGETVTPAPGATRTTAPSRDAVQQLPRSESRELRKTASDERNVPSEWDDVRQQMHSAADGIRGLAILVGLFVYLGLVLLTGAWVARDANTRGMPGLG